MKSWDCAGSIPVLSTNSSARCAGFRRKGVIVCRFPEIGKHPCYRSRVLITTGVVDLLILGDVRKVTAGCQDQAPAKEFAMKGYGLPRRRELEYPDLGDIAIYGLKAGNLHPKWTANGNNKRKARRVWKKIERSRAKREFDKYKST